MYLAQVILIYLLHIKTSTNLISLASYCFLFDLLPHHCKFQVITPKLYRWQSGAFQNHWVYQGNDMAVKSASEKCNITVQLLVIVSLISLVKYREKGSIDSKW